MAAKWPPDRPLARGGLVAFREFVIDGGTTIIGLFQGRFGQRPDLDSIVKYQQRGKQIRTPKHLHWAIDLLLKRQHDPNLTRKFMSFLIETYDQVQPYSSVNERATRHITFASETALYSYVPLNQYGEYSVEFTAHIVEIMAAIEKTSNPNAFMFKRVLSLCSAPESELDIFAIVSAAAFRGA